ncbi:MAG: T9SS type A sorting domain-containing protein [Bacteroidales bacterium]|nr:T9SS type A sorting domain-containing protein [Bacteroidales bacterium]
MTSKRHCIFVIICVLSCSAVFAQELHKEISTQQYSSSFPEALKIDISKPFKAGLFSPPPNRSNHPSRQTNNGWYPTKGEIYYTPFETEIGGYIYYKMGQNGLLDKQILVANHPNLYDSTVSVMNRTPYTKGKDLFDTTYNYIKLPDGSYRPELKRIYSYHYFDHFEADSFYYENIYQFWDAVNHKWNNYGRQKTGYHDTLVEFLNRFEEYHAQGNVWKTNFCNYDSITYDHQGLVDTLYMIRDYGNGDRLPKSKAAFTYDEQGRYTQIDYFTKSGNNWNKVQVRSNITWTEWHGFTYCSVFVVGTEWVSPYTKRSKQKSYYIDTPTSSFVYQKWWDIDGTQSNKDSLYQIIGNTLHGWTNDNIYNEYGDYVKWQNTYYTQSVESGEVELLASSSTYHKRVYDDIYGMTEHFIYLIQFDKAAGLPDTTIFVDGIRYTEFAPVSIVEHPQTKQTLHIFPNPTSGAITISATAEIEQLRIFDITGRLVSDQSPASRQVVFDTGVLPNGIYLVQARLKDGRVQTGKLVVR